jgi:4-azaleucine resistance transporter AzlC
MSLNTVKQAFYKSVPVMAGYIVLGIGFGILLGSAGYGVLWAFAISLFVYAGSMQYVGVSLLAGGASVITMALTTIMVNARHLFYSISMVDRYKDAGKYKPYLIFGLTDETYSLLCDGKTPENTDPNLYRFLVTLFNQSYWVTGSVLGSLLGAVLPFSTEGIEFSMTALFIASFIIRFASSSALEISRSATFLRYMVPPKNPATAKTSTMIIHTNAGIGSKHTSIL